MGYVIYPSLCPLVYIISFKLFQVSTQIAKPDHEADKEQTHDAQNRAKAEKHVIKRACRDFLK